MKQKSFFDHKRISVATFRKKKKNRISLVLDNIRSAHNVGAAFRIADAFLLQHVYLGGITPKPPHPQIRKTALGATDALPWTHVDETTQALLMLREQGYQCVAVEQANPSLPLQKLKQAILPDRDIALVFGHEVFGISEGVLAQVDQCVEIPQYGTKISMNVSVCIGIVVWELLRP